MRAPHDTTDRLLLALAVALALVALGLAQLAPGFSLDQSLVYGGF